MKEIFIQIEQYTIIRCSYGKNSNKYKAHDVNEPKVHYVLKEHKTNDTFERELRALSELRNPEVCIIIFFLCVLCVIYFNFFFFKKK